MNCAIQKTHTPIYLNRHAKIVALRSRKRISMLFPCNSAMFASLFQRHGAELESPLKGKQSSKLSPFNASPFCLNSNSTLPAREVRALI